MALLRLPTDLFVRILYDDILVDILHPLWTLNRHWKNHVVSSEDN